MFHKIRLLALLSVIFVFASCDDSLDKIFQEPSKVKPAQLLTSIKIIPEDQEAQTYSFEYNEDLKLINFTNPGAKPFSLVYKEENGTLNNFKKVISGIFYLDKIFKIPYDHTSYDIIPQNTNELGEPYLLKLILYSEDEPPMVKYVEIGFYQLPNMFKPYLMAGGIIEAAEQNQLDQSRAQLFEGRLIPSNIPASIDFMDEDMVLEHSYDARYEYDQMQRITRGKVTYSKAGKKESTMVTELICSYLDSAIN